MTKSDAWAVEKLKEIIDKNGPGYLTKEPYKVYKALAASGKEADRKIAGAILCTLVSDAVVDTGSEVVDQEALSKRVQGECGFNKSISDRVAAVFASLYSDDHKREWAGKDHEGLAQFMSEEFECIWNGSAVWDESNGFVACHYSAEIKLKPEKAVNSDKELVKMLKQNPFTTKETIHEYYAKKLREYLDDEFEDYCTCDDYYQPVVEDFEIESYLEDWCKENNFKLVSCDGSGFDSGYEPKYRNGWY